MLFLFIIMPNKMPVILYFKAWRRDRVWNEIVTLSVENPYKLTAFGQMIDDSFATGIFKRC